jgi:hypothetical protein
VRHLAQQERADVQEASVRLTKISDQFFVVVVGQKVINARRPGRNSGERSLQLTDAAARAAEQRLNRERASARTKSIFGCTNRSARGEIDCER